MKGIKYIAFALLLLFSCNQESLTDFTDTGLNFIRFSMITDPDGKLIRDITSQPSRPEVPQYHHTSLDTIFIPVVRSADNGNAISVDISVSSSEAGLENDLYRIIPEERQIRMEDGVFISFVTIALLRSWTIEEEVVLDLTIESVSDPQLTIGYPRQDESMAEVRVTIGGVEVIPNGYALSTSSIALEGIAGEVHEWEVTFNQDILTGEIGTSPELLSINVESLCDPDFNFDYTLVQQPFNDGDRSITYTFTLLEDIPDEVTAALTVQLLDGLHPRYSIDGTAVLTLRHEGRQFRTDDDAAALWYNLDDPFYRTFGYAWYENNGECRWQKFFALTQALPVDPTDPNNNGNGYHKYKISFFGTNVGTNPFNTRRYYGGTSASSPAFDLEEGLEFFPETATSGRVEAVAQNLVFIRRSDDAMLVIPMCGSGTYQYRPEINGYEMYIEVHYDETAIGGPDDVVHPMYIYSFDNDAAPPLLEDPCVPYLDL